MRYIQNCWAFDNPDSLYGGWYLDPAGVGEWNGPADDKWLCISASPHATALIGRARTAIPILCLYPISSPPSISNYSTTPTPLFVAVHVAVCLAACSSVWLCAVLWWLRSGQGLAVSNARLLVLRVAHCVSLAVHFHDGHRKQRGYIREHGT